MAAKIEKVQNNLIQVNFGDSSTELVQNFPPKKPRKRQKLKNSTTNGNGETTKSKSTLAYWKSAIRQRTYRHKGELRRCADYSVRIAHDGEQHDIPLKISDREKAAAKAKSIWESVVANGWERTLLGLGVKSKGDALTFGDYLAEFLKMPGVALMTAEEYRKKVITLVAEVAEIKRSPSVKAPRKELEKWRRKVEKVRICSLSDRQFTKWRESCRLALERGEVCGQIKRRRSASTINGLIRAYKAVFRAEQIEKFAYLDLPEKIPGASLRLLREPSYRYKGGIDAQALLDKADSELRETNVEAYKVLLLTLVCGLRRTEADLLLWSSFDFSQSCIHVTATEYYQLKSKSSEGVTYFSEEVCRFFQECFAGRSGEFVLESKRPPLRHKVTYQYHRAEKAQEELIAWLRANGVKSRKPIHSLRKEFGSLINEAYGIHTASSALRHSTVTVTESHYICRKVKPVVGLGRNRLSVPDGSG
ncbi:tyrosine-type recombinase/integrase [Pelagicoccus sp. SDUM812003]|uniref:tyrosine-type recombinase/integrase n=1 Tax=Pelagicoccus sp. SDUM812003 TaxID=3041267 RepID=UPI00280F8758|nr:tyrosine-type recombinase/integrase [Pelagicoccus sp. SDUM812003]MDQ8201405.1 tyrosine-type recombinase/integrase [Pelagicoccus sp. SDUM812003]